MLLPLFFFCKSILFLYVYYSSEYNRWYMKLPIYPFDNTFQGAYIEEEVIMTKYIHNIFKSYFIEQLVVYCYEQLFQLRILISRVVYMMTGKEINSFQPVEAVPCIRNAFSDNSRDDMPYELLY